MLRLSHVVFGHVACPSWIVLTQIKTQRRNRISPCPHPKAIASCELTARWPVETSAPLLHCGLGKCEPKKRFMGPTLAHTSSLNDTQCAFVGMAMPPACAGAVWGTFREGGGLLGLQQRKRGGGGGCSLEVLPGGGG